MDNNTVIIETVHDEKAYVTQCALQLRAAQTKRRAAKEMLDDYLGNSSDYKNAAQAIELNQQAKKQSKARLLATPAGNSLATKLKDVNDEIAELKESLSGALEVYWQKTSNSNIDTPTGVAHYKRQFVIPADQLKLF